MDTCDLKGAINVFKPQKMTSHDVVSRIRKIYQIKKVGHAGTLDPDASGVLPVFIGNTTRLIEYMVEEDKCYEAEMIFGYETDSADITGKITNKTSGDLKIPARDVIEENLKSFIGTIYQMPPMYSALKKDGKKLYQLARKGITVERELREVTIHSLEILNISEDRMTIEVNCSKGTYIRTLCEDIGRKLGILATMSSLIRKRVGSFNISDSHTLEQIQDNKEKVLLSADKVIDLPVFMINLEQSSLFKNGIKIKVKKNDFDYEISINLKLKIFDIHDNFIGIGEVVDIMDSEEIIIAPKKVLAR